MKRYLVLLAVSVFLFELAGCSHPIATQVSAKIVQSAKTRIIKPQVDTSDLNTLTADNSAFAFDLYQKLRSQNGNLVFSPFSISEALVMTFAGANGETAQQMAAVLHFTLPPERLHPAFNALDQQLNSQGTSEFGVKLNVVNALWGEQSLTFLPAFLDTLSQNYGAGMRLLDFANFPEPSRLAINDWVSSQTAQKINDLLPPGSIDPLSELVLTNVVYLKAFWNHPFQSFYTAGGPFTLADGSQVSVPFMQETQMLDYAEDGAAQMIGLPYADSSLSMVILLPKGGSLDSYEASLDANQVAPMLATLKPQLIKLSLPKFKFDASFSLVDTLTALGMPDAFDDNLADFSGMENIIDIKIGGVLHKAFIAVDEEGTEAAAATGVAMTQIVSGFAGTPLAITVDRPFMFVIMDRSSGTILFLGRVMDPRG